MLKMVATGMETGAFPLIALTLVPPSLSCDRFLEVAGMGLVQTENLIITITCNAHATIATVVH